MRLFLDANILFSAAYREDSAAALLFDLAAHGLCQLLTSAFALEEARRNLVAKSINGGVALERLAAALVLVPEPPPARVASAMHHGLPEKDAPIFAAAIDANADVLVTGDRIHFGHLFGKKAGSVRILRLAEVYAELLA